MTREEIEKQRDALKALVAMQKASPESYEAAWTGIDRLCNQALDRDAVPSEAQIQAEALAQLLGAAILRLKELGETSWELPPYARALKREPSAARLGQGWVPMAWMVTWNGETTDDIFCIEGAAIECMARRNIDYPNDTWTIVPLAIIPPAPGASDE